MASSAPKIAEAERFESPATVTLKAKALAEHIRRSRHFIAFSGAGVSTSTGIPDFRGPDGAWTLLAQGRQRTTQTVSTLQAIPSPTHMALVELQNRGILKYLVSQNCDGLHRRSGIPCNKISELHGNSNRECCGTCGKEYIRDFRAVASYEKTVFDHRTGRKCALCGGALHDTIVNFGEALPARAMQFALVHAQKADLCLVLGSSLTVTPANEVPQAINARYGAKLAICNLQSTPLDELSDLRIFTKTDDLMVKVMEELEIPIPAFILRRRLSVCVEATLQGGHRITTLGVDEDGTPVTFLRSVKLEHNRRVARSEPFVMNVRDSLPPNNHLKLELEFMGHYREPNLQLDHIYQNVGDEATLYLLEFNPQNGEWKVRREGSAAGMGSILP